MAIRIPEELHLTVMQINDPEKFQYNDRVARYECDYLAIGRLVGQRILDIINGKNPEPLHQEVLHGEIVEPVAVAAA